MRAASAPPAAADADGAGPSGGGGPFGVGPSRPLPTRRRRWPLGALGALLVVGFALAGGVVVQRGTAATAVVVASRPVAAGHPIAAADLSSARIAGAVRAIAWREAARQVVGRTAAVDLVAGQLVNPDMLSALELPAAGQALVGLDLKPGLLPTGDVAAGDRVRVVAVPAANDAAGGAAALAEPPVLAGTARVFAVRPDPATSGATLLTLVVADDAAARVTGYGSAGQAAVLKVAR